MTQRHTELLRGLARCYGLDHVLCTLSRLAAEEPFARPSRPEVVPPALPPTLRDAVACDKHGHIVGLPLSGHLVAQNIQTGIGLLECGGKTLQIHLEWFQEQKQEEIAAPRTTKTTTKKASKNWLQELMEKR